MYRLLQFFKVLRCRNVGYLSRDYVPFKGMMYLSYLSILMGDIDHLRQVCHSSEFCIVELLVQKRNACRCTFNRCSVITQFAKLAAGEQLSRCCTHRKVYTYLLTPWCRVLLEKLTGLQLVKKFPAFHGTRRFITIFTSARRLSLSWASPIQSIYPHPISWRSILILFTHLRLGLPSGLIPSGFPTKTLYTPPLLTHTRQMPSPSYSSRFYHNIG